MFNRIKSLFTPETNNPIAALSALEAAAKRDRCLFVDVREPHEFADAHIAGALLMPLGTLSKRWSELQKHADIVVVCRSGNRSAAACRQLQAAGITQAANLSGGMLAWSAANLPTVSGNA